ncbi:MAG: DsbA family protein [Rhizomicrobium sp.]
MNLTRQHLLFGLVGLAVIALGVIAYFVFWGESGTGPISGEKYGITFSSRDRGMGSPNAPVMMVEYAAPTCPHCAAFDMEIFPLLKKTYIDTGKVYYVFRVFPLNSADVAAEAIARCLSKENYFPFIDQLYRNQPKWDPEYGVSDVHAGLVQMGAMAGIGAQEVDSCISNAKEQTAITNVGTEAQAKYNVNGTPTFIVNGEQRVGEGTWEDWQDYLNKKLANPK